jgi:hypothetical protein
MSNIIDFTAVVKDRQKYKDDMLNDIGNKVIELFGKLPTVPSTDDEVIELFDTIDTIHAYIRKQGYDFTSGQALVGQLLEAMEKKELSC